MTLPPSHDNQWVNFGFSRVREAEKTQMVQGVFSDVASYYDIMNDVMSLGMHRLWKDSAISILNPQANQNILDLAAGTGDLTSRILDKSPKSHVHMADLNENMLREGIKNLHNAGHIQNFSCIQANAEALPFPDQAFDKTIISFGIRNVTNLEKAISELYRVTKDFGQTLIMEFSLPQSPFANTLSVTYLTHILPLMGQFIANDKPSYEYLAQSIQRFPKPADFEKMLRQNGFDHIKTHAFMLGNVRLYQCFKTVSP